MKTFRITTKVDMITIVIIESTQHETILDEVGRNLDRMENDLDHDYEIVLVMVDNDDMSR